MSTVYYTKNLITDFIKLINKTILKKKMSIIKPKDFNVEKINYVGPRVNDYGGKNVYLNYDANDSSDDTKSKSLILKTPLMPMPYKIGRYESDSGDYVKYAVDVSFRNMATEEEVSGLEKQVSKLLKKLSSA